MYRIAAKVSIKFEIIYSNSHISLIFSYVNSELTFMYIVGI